MFKLIMIIVHILVISNILPFQTLYNYIVSSRRGYVLMENNIGNDTLYQYFIIGQSGKIIDYDLVENHCPIISSVTNAIISVSIPAGNVMYTTFYDIVNEEKSKEYQNVQFVNDDIIVFTDFQYEEWYLVISDPFSKTFIKKIPIDLASATGMLETIMMNDVKQNVCITYISDEEYKEKTIVVGLKEWFERSR